MSESLYNRFCDELNSGRYANNFIMSLPSHVREVVFPNYEPKAGPEAKTRTDTEHSENKT